MNVDRIVVGTDFSSMASEAVAHAVSLARHTGAEVDLVHVGMVPEKLEDPHQFGPYDREVRAYVDSEFRKSRSNLQEIRDRYHGQGVELSNTVIQGSPAESLCDFADERHADLIVVGSHGYSGLKHFLIGSIAERVIRLANTNVLLARGSCLVRGFQRLLVPVDFEEGSKRAVELALELSGDDAEIELFHCWQFPPGLTDDWAAGSPAIIEDVRQAVRKRTEEKLNELLLRYRGRGANLVFEQDECSPKLGIAERVARGDVDLIVLGSHGRKGMARLFLGSVAESVARHASCSVAIAKPK